MVVFTCNNCGETLQKPKVAKHYEFQCRSAPFVTCVDCFKDFRGDEYVTHTKCITEAERYGGKDYVAKSSANKGEKKQQEWINVVNNILNSNMNLSNEEKSFLRVLSKYDNIPRKKAKFLNFVRNAMGQRKNPAMVDSVWAKMEEAYKSNSQNNTGKQPQGNGAEDKDANTKDVKGDQENNVIENQNNENIDREIQNGDQQTTGNGANDDADNNGVSSIKKKKSKKRAVSETIEKETEQAVVKSNGDCVAKDTEEPLTKKKKKKHVNAEEQTHTEKNQDTSYLESNHISQCDDTMEKSTFNWKDTILEIVKTKGEISLKKLQKKVISQYRSSCSTTITEEKATSRFNKKFRKLSDIVISNDKVKLA